MGILDEAIKEHLELKRQHGAGESELKQLEDEAFGDAERPGGGESPPDPFAEAPTEFMSAPEAGEAPAIAEPTPEKGESPRRTSPDIAGLQEAPEPPPIPDEPAEEEQPAMEHEVVVDPPQPAAEVTEEPSPGHSTEERHAIAEQPTEMYDVEGEIAASESPAPSEEELVEEEVAEPRLAPVDPLAGLNEVEEEGEIEVSAEEPAEEEEEDDFFDEKRLYEELDQALEAPVEVDEEAEEPESVVEVEEVEVELTDEHELPDEEESDEHEDLLEDTPDFLEDAPEDDQLWFEQKPPKDFDFDD